MRAQARQMTTDLLTALCHFGHVATTAQLRQCGATKQMVAAAIANGSVLRPLRGHYACAHVNPDVLSAVRVGGRIDCVSALVRHGVWSGTTKPGLHLRLEPHEKLRRAPNARIHWSVPVRTAFGFEVSPLDAVLQAITCLAPPDALACVESAMHLKFLTEAELDEVLMRAPERLHSILALLDRGAQSGFETHCRLKLLEAGFTVQTQFMVRGAGHLDMLVNGCVGVETDGRQWHADSFLADRTRDLLMEAAGFRVIRLAREHIFDSWPRSLVAIQRMVNV